MSHVSIHVRGKSIFFSSPKRLDRLTGRQACIHGVPRFFQWEQSSQGVMLATHLSLVSRSRNSGDVITLLYIFLACTGTSLLFLIRPAYQGANKSLARYFPVYFV